MNNTFLVPDIKLDLDGIRSIFDRQGFNPNIKLLMLLDVFLTATNDDEKKVTTLIASTCGIANLQIADIIKTLKGKKMNMYYNRDSWPIFFAISDYIKEIEL